MTIAFSLIVVIGSAAAEQGSVNQSDDGGTWDGTWHSDLFNMTLIQKGDTITSSYYPLNPNLSVTGELVGTLDESGTVMKGTWHDIGNFTFTLSDDGSSFSGIWGYDDDVGTYLGESAEGWNGTWNSANFTMKFVQVNTTVTGIMQTLNPESGESGSLTGAVSEDGKKLTGTWVETGACVFNLSKDGSYFNGTFNNGSEPTMPFDTWNGTRFV